MRYLSVLVIFMLPMLACTANPSVSLELDENFSYLTVTMDEADVVSSIETVMTAGDSQFESLTADLQPGAIAFRGNVRTNTGDLVPGSLSVRIWAQDGELQAAVQSFSFGQMTAQEAGIDEFNRKLAESLSRSAEQRRNPDAKLADVTVTNTSISMTIQSPRRGAE